MYCINKCCNDNIINMKFTINDLKARGPIGHKQFKKVYDWDYVKYETLESVDYIAAYRNNEKVREFSTEEFATLVVLTNCENDWYEVPNSLNDKVFSALDIAQIIDIMQEYKRNLNNEQAFDFEATISFCKKQLEKHGFQYYWPAAGSKFNSDIHYAVGYAQNTNCNPGEIAYNLNGGVKNIVTGKIYKYPKVYIA